MSFFSSLLLLVGCCSQAKAFTTLAATARISGQRTTTVHVATDITTPIDDAPITQDSQSRPPREQRRILGSQENLMLPRQYSPGKDVFPQMNHVCVAVLSSTPSEQVLRQAIDETMAAHPFLRCKIDGDGEPDERIDLFQMVRKGEPNPCTFSSNGPGQFTSRDVLQVIDVLNDDDRVALYASWKQRLATTLMTVRGVIPKRVPCGRSNGTVPTKMSLTNLALWYFPSIMPFRIRAVPIAWSI